MTRIILALGLMVCLLAGSLTATAASSGPPAATALDVYRASATALLENELVPRLRRGATWHSGIPRFAVRVIPSRDPMRLDVERLPDGSVDVAVSSGFLLFADALVDAEVLGRLANQRPEVERFFDDVVAFAGEATRPGVESRMPGTFYTRLGWKKALYDLTFASAEYQDTRSEVFVQAFTWIIAHAVVAAVHGEGHDADRTAAEWLAQSGFAPLPNVGMTMLYFAARDQARESVAQWRCRTRLVLETGVETVESLEARGVSLPKHIPTDLLARGSELAAETAPSANCVHPQHARITKVKP